jgi:hypothetical protein
LAQDLAQGLFLFDQLAVGFDQDAQGGFQLLAGAAEQIRFQARAFGRIGDRSSAWAIFGSALRRRSSDPWRRCPAG